MDSVLVAEGLNTFYGKSHILFDVTLRVNRQETLCLMGRNGAGKTTTFKTLVSVLRPHTGSIFFKGIEITKKKPFEVARLGLSLVPEDRRIFPTLTVKENLLMGASTGRKGMWNLDMVFEFFPILKDYKSRLGGNLSGGEQQMLTIARTLMGNPEVILLDEPSEGLSPVMVSILKELILKLKSVGSTIILSEQNVKFAQSVSDRVLIIDKGSICYESDIETFKKNDEVKKAYLAV